MSRIVHHKTLGDGEFIKLDTAGGYITIQFPQRVGPSTFLFPQAFCGSDPFLTVTDEELKEELGLRTETSIKKELLYKIKQNNPSFIGFLSYTHFDNFIAIMKSGTQYCRNRAPKLYNDSASHRVLEETPKKIEDYVRFYMKEGTPTLYWREGIKLNPKDPCYAEYDYAHEPIPVCIVYYESILFDKGTGITDGRPGNDNTSKDIFDIEKALYYRWDIIFSRGKYSEIPNTDGIHGSQITNYRNAEFVYPFWISTERIKCIKFRCRADQKHAEFLLGENPLFGVDSKMFIVSTKKENEYVGDRNYLDDYHVKYDSEKRKYILDLYFKNLPDKYEHEVIIHYKNHEDKTIDLTGWIVDKEANCEISVDWPDDVERVEYLLNGHVSAVWRPKEEI